MSTNRLRELFAAGGNAIGGWCSTPSAYNAEVFAVEGYDYVCVDCQHGLIGYDAMVPMLASISRTSATPIVRVPFNHTPWMGQAFDAGAEAVVVPMVNSREDAERAVAGCRYAPEGVRSFGPTRAGLYLNQAKPADVNREVMCFVMIETVQAVANVVEICSTPGVDGVYIGPADLAISMGIQFPFEGFTAEHLHAMEHVRQVCVDHGIIPGIHTGGGQGALDAITQGFRMATVSTDAGLFRTTVAEHLAAARGQAESSEGSIY